MWSGMQLSSQTSRKWGNDILTYMKRVREQKSWELWDAAWKLDLLEKLRLRRKLRSAL